MDASAPATTAARLLGKAVDVRPEERAALLRAFAYFFALLASYYLLRPIREEMGIRGGVEKLQWSFSATFIAATLAVPAWSALVARVPRSRAVPLVYRFFVLNLIGFGLLFRFDVAPVHTARAFFVWLSVFNLLVVAVFWSLMADLFTGEQGRRLFGFVAAGGSLGAIAGSAGAGIAVTLFGIPTVVFASAVLLELSARLAIALARSSVHGEPVEPRTEAGSRARDDAPVGGTALSGIWVVFRSRYLLALSAQILLFTLVSTFLYFQQARIVRDAIPHSGRRTALFAAVDLAVNVASFVIQFVATGRLAAAFGLTPALTVVPALSAAGFLALAATPSLVVLASFQVLRRVGHYALERRALDVLYTVVPREEKYKSKSFIDTVVYRVGDVTGAWMYAGLAALGMGPRGLALSALPLAAAALAIGLWLPRRERQMEQKER